MARAGLLIISQKPEILSVRVKDSEAIVINTFEKIYEQVRKIPRGRVATYGQIAMMAGNPRWSQVVGYALHVNPDPANIKCYRVVNRSGELSDAFAFGGRSRQAELLCGEGVEIDENGRVDLKKYGIDPSCLGPDREEQ